MVWRDSTGAVIPVLATVAYPDPAKVFPYLLIADANSVIWPVNPTTGNRFTGTPIITPTQYTGAGCTGTPYVLASDVLPGFAYIGNLPGIGAAVVPAGTVAVSRSKASTLNPNFTCTDAASTALMYPMTFVVDFPGQFFSPPALPQFVP